ncbi:MAG: DUF2235 domain-containing protein [Candidatus Omnitrophota bacterium]|nr:MAG: DUF2235 domain-containing protein [Candidatus Omnitrophota bacterium]
MKRLAVFCDGTWQDLKTDYPTNVVKLMQAMKNKDRDGVAQIAFYDAGIGTAGWYDKLAGGALGKGIDTNILDCYRFLILNYEPGDEVYLFGFSRGAYTVRSLAGLIYCSGLPQRQHIRRIHEAYQLYRDPAVKPSSEKARNFRLAYGENIAITLLGCWDTVGALGIPSHLLFSRRINKKYQFHDTNLNRKISHALHAVSIDEPRNAFNVTPMHRSEGAVEQDIEEVWFPGDHGAVGGNKDKAGLSDITLQWMIEQIKICNLGLSFDAGYVQPPLNPNHAIPFKITMSPFDRIVCGRIVRTITAEFKDIHESAKKRWHDCLDYRPNNLVDKFKEELDRWI